MVIIDFVHTVARRLGASLCAFSTVLILNAACTGGSQSQPVPRGEQPTAATSSQLLRVDQPPPPCHPNPNAAADAKAVLSRGDIVNLPGDLKDRLQILAERPHSVLPVQTFAEADGPSRFFQYYLLDTNNFEPNVLTKRFAGINDKAMLTATGFNCGLPTVGAVRLVLEPKPGLPTDPEDVRSFIDVFTDISGLFVINNESGWYEGWMVYDLDIPDAQPPRQDGHAQFGAITQGDADKLKAMGNGHNVSGALFTTDGKDVRPVSASDKFPSVQTNLVNINLSMGAYNALQQGDAHAYWEFNYTTNWVHPLYELPFTGGFMNSSGGPADAFEKGLIGKLSSLIPGSGPLGVQNKPEIYGDSPNLPRDPDKFDAEDDAQREMRQRFIPSGLAEEIFLDVYERPDSFEPQETDVHKRLFKAYAAEVARIDTNGDGVISALEGDVDSASDGFADNTRLYIPVTEWKHFAVTREINDGYLAPRFAPSQRAWVLSGEIESVSPAVPASEGRDGDDR